MKDIYYLLDSYQQEIPKSRSFRAGSHDAEESRAIARWSIMVLKHEIWNHPTEKVEDIAEHLIQKMDKYSTINKSTSYIFSTAKDILQDVYDRLFLFDGYYPRR